MTSLEGLKKPVDCVYCMDENGQSLGYTLVVGTKLTCPVCGGKKKV